MGGGGKGICGRRRDNVLWWLAGGGGERARGREFVGNKKDGIALKRVVGHCFAAFVKRC